MRIREKERLIEQLIQLLDEPWDNNAELIINLFYELGRLHGVSMLVANPLSTRSLQIIRGISCLLAHVEAYPDEITCLYVWLDAIAKRLDESSAGCIATAIQGHIAIFSVNLPLEHSIERVMIPFLLENLTVNDWTTRDSAVCSLNMLDGISRLGKWSYRSATGRATAKPARISTVKRRARSRFIAFIWPPQAVC